MNFNDDFEYYLTQRYSDVLPIDHILEIERHIDVNYIIPLKAELFTLQQFKNNAVIEDKQRNADILKLCEAVLNMNTHSTGDYGMGGECPMCNAMCRWNDSISDCQHDENCAYLIAKDLSTNLL